MAAQEASRRFGKLALLVFTLLAVGAATFAFAIVYGDVDRCLDTGGRWNNAQSICEH